MNGKFKLIIAFFVAIVSLITYFGSSSKNEITGETQRIGISKEQEVALGLEARPEMERQFGGRAADGQAQARIDRIGETLVAASAAKDSGYPFEFHVLADDQTINAFALPGGQVFITTGLLKRLKTDGEVAGVLGHEIGHVVARHSAERIAKQQLTQGLTGAAVLATYDPGNRSSEASAQIAMLVGNLVNMKYGRDDELESDRLGVRFMAEAGYDPRALIQVMKVLAEAGGGSQPEFFSTHPNPENRVGRIEEAIREQFPNGVPSGLMR